MCDRYTDGQTDRWNNRWQRSPCLRLSLCTTILVTDCLKRHILGHFCWSVLKTNCKKTAKFSSNLKNIDQLRGLRILQIGWTSKVYFLICSWKKKNYKFVLCDIEFCVFRSSMAFSRTRSKLTPYLSFITFWLNKLPRAMDCCIN